MCCVKTVIQAPIISSQSKSNISTTHTATSCMIHDKWRPNYFFCPSFSCISCELKQTLIGSTSQGSCNLISFKHRRASEIFSWFLTAHSINTLRLFSGVKGHSEITLCRSCFSRSVKTWIIQTHSHNPEWVILLFFCSASFARLCLY